MGNNFPTAEYLFNHKDTITHNIDKQRALVLMGGLMLGLGSMINMLFFSLKSIPDHGY